MYQRAERRRDAERADAVEASQTPRAEHVAFSAMIPPTDDRLEVPPIAAEVPPPAPFTAWRGPDVPPATSDIDGPAPASVMPVDPIAPHIVLAPPRQLRRTTPRPAFMLTAIAAVTLATMTAIAWLLWPVPSTDTVTITNAEPVAGEGTAPAATAQSPAFDTAVPVADQVTRASSSEIAGQGPRNTGADADADAEGLDSQQASSTSASPAAPTATPTPASRATEGRLRITSSPSGARVTINGIGWGQTPVTIGNLPFGAKSVRVTMDGYRSQERGVMLSGDRPSVSMHLTLRAASR